LATFGVLSRNSGGGDVGVTLEIVISSPSTATSSSLSPSIPLRGSSFHDGDGKDPVENVILLVLSLSRSSSEATIAIVSEDSNEGKKTRCREISGLSGIGEGGGVFLGVLDVLWTREHHIRISEEMMFKMDELNE
jgi:hypothetical protein